MNEQDSGVKVVRGCLTEEGQFYPRCLLLRSLASELQRQVTSFLGS